MWPMPRSFFTALQTSKPLTLGIMTSRKTRFGSSSRMVARASSPLLAVSSSTPSSSRSSSVCWIRVRRWGSSSTIKIFIGLTARLCSLIDQEEDILHAFFKAQGANSFVAREDGVENDDVGLREDSMRDEFIAIRFDNLVSTGLEGIGECADGRSILVDHHDFLLRLSLVEQGVHFVEEADRIDGLGEVAI